jgi:predicted acylesterase/phospholipase RssA
MIKNKNIEYFEYGCEITEDESENEPGDESENEPGDESENEPGDESENGITNKCYDTLVISGGSTKGLIALGSLQYLSEQYLLKNINTYIGTSIGSIISYFIIIGYTPIEIVVYICKNNVIEKINKLNLCNIINGEGVISFSLIHEILEKMTIEKIGFLPTLQQLKNKFNKTLVCTTYNLTKDCPEYISYKNYPDLPCLTALRMSSNLPMVFEKYKYGDNFYIDGGVYNNFPVDIAHDYGENILSILLKHKSKYDLENKNTLEYLYNLLIIPMSSLNEYKIQQFSKNNKIIQFSKYSDIKPFDFGISSKDKLEMFSYGYQHTSTLKI